MKKMSKGMLMTALICGAVYLGGSPVYASELQEFSLDEYVVTAARTETKLVDTPANISVVDSQTIEERHYQDVSEVLKDVPGANVMDNGVGASEKVIRLNGDDRVLVLVDGRRVTNDVGSTSSGRNGMDLNLLPDVNLIERVEVLKGAGGALYGSDAVGGVVNIITKKSDVNYGKISYSMGSSEHRNINALYSFKENKTGVTLSASKDKQGYYKYKDVKNNSTKRWGGNSKYENEKVSLKIDQSISDYNNILIGYDYSKYDGTNPFDITGRNGARLDKESKNLYAKYDWTTNNNDTGYVQYYHNEYEYNNYATGNEGSFEEKSNGLDIQQELSISDNNKIVIGASWRKSDVNVKGVSHYNDSIENIAFFINDTWEFAPTWSLSTGARYDDHSEAGDETTFSAGLNKKFNDNNHIYINWGQVFKAPTTDDLFYYSPPGSDGQYSWGPSVGNKNLKPETGETWTIGYNASINKATDVGINYFESDLDDAINWLSDYSTNGYIVDNVQNQKKRGMELTLDHKLNDNVELTASYTYIRVKNDYSNQGYLKDYHYMPNTYRIGVNYHDGKWDTNLWLRAANGGSTSLNARYGYGGWVSNATSYCDSGYVTVDLSVTYKASKDLSIYAKGYNLFNEAYAEFAGVDNGSYKYPAQSRRFIVGAEYKF